jgi:hypothetical protein
MFNSLAGHSILNSTGEQMSCLYESAVELDHQIEADETFWHVIGDFVELQETACQASPQQPDVACQTEGHGAQGEPSYSSPFELNVACQTEGEFDY